MRLTRFFPLLILALLATLPPGVPAQESHQLMPQRAAEAPARPLNLSLPHLAPGQVRMGQREEVRQMQSQGGVTGSGEALQLQQQQQSRFAVQMRYGSGYEARHAGAGGAAAASSAAPAMGPGNGRGR